MTPLTKQLEDKKKGCGELDNWKWICGKKKCRLLGENNKIKWELYLCPKCKAEIAILEQAIAEKNKMRNTAKVRILRFCEMAQRKDTNYYLNKAEALQEFFVITDEELEAIKNIQSHIYRGNSSEEKDNQRVPISESATDELNNESKAHSQLSLQKQRQEILDEIGYKIFSEDEQKSNNVWYKKGWDDSAKRINKVIQEVKELNCLPINYIEINEKIDKLVEEQLNQPKTENSILIDTGMKPEDWIYNGEFEQLNQPKTEQ